MNIVRRNVPGSAQALMDAGVDPVLARVFAARGIDRREELDDDLAQLPHFGTLKGIDAAAKRLADAIARREKIVVVADYDADGATACAVAVRGLSALGALCEFVVPNRFEYGYGLTAEIVALAATRTPRLIVTVDNGIASHDGVTAAAALGIDVLITDHHLPAATLPSPAWIVNPNQPGCAFAGKHLAGVGVMFYVLLATRALLRECGVCSRETQPNLAALLDLVALGTVADVVRLDRINRTLVAQGLARIRAQRCQPGLLALFQVAGRNPAHATTYDLGFVIGPRLNAAGRLADMSAGIACLLADSIAAALPLAANLDQLNRERRDVGGTMEEQAIAEIESQAVASAIPEDACSICLYKAEWHQGVIGIVAARLKERYHRPALVFARGAGDEIKGSGRSIDGLHLRDALDIVSKRIPGIIRGFGGHAYAAGLTLREADLAAFAAAFEALAREALTPAHLRRVLDSDGSLAPGELALQLAWQMREQVWGQGFPHPVFDDVFCVTEQRVVAGRHLRLSLTRQGERHAAMLFNHVDPLPKTVRAAYRPDLEEWNGTWGLQLVIEAWDAA